MTLPYELANTLFDISVDPNEVVVGRSFYYADASPRVNRGPNSASLVEYDGNAVAGQIEMVLGTPLGSEAFEPTFGSDVTKRLFDNMTQANLSGLELEALDALRRWLGARLDFLSVSANKDSATGDVFLLIPFRVKLTGQKQTYIGNLSILARG